MPTVGGGVNKADVYYDVIRRIPIEDWNSFARRMLKLPDSVIGDIKMDHDKSFQEQRYQMLLRWEQMNGFKATPAELLKLQNQFLEFPERGGGEQANTERTQAVQEPPPNENNAMPPVPTNNSGSPAGYTREQIIYRGLLGNISDKMTTGNLTRIKEIFDLKNRNFSTASDLFYYLDNQGLWGDANYLDKMSMMQDIMKGMNQRDAVRLIEQAKLDMYPNLTGDQAILRGLAENQDRSTTPESMEFADTHPSITHEQTMGLQQFPSGVQNMDIGHSSSLYKPIPQRATQGSQETRTNQKQTPSSGDTRNQNAQPIQNPISTPAVHVQNMIIYGERAAINMHQVAAAATSQARSRQGKRKQATVADICKFEGAMNVELSEAVDYEEHLNDERIYQIRNDPKGHVLILSNTEFSKWGPRHDRIGGKRDLKLMKDLWEGLGCKTIVRENCTKAQMKSVLEAFAKQRYHWTSDLAVVIVMSHGGQVEGGVDVVYGVDGLSIPAEDIVSMYDNDNCKCLQKKPKLFFFQFCRGSTGDTGADVADSSITSTPPVSLLDSLMPVHDAADSGPILGERLPTRCDMLVAYATFAGNTAFRHEADGSWFMNAIANVFMRGACDTHVNDLLTQVKNGLLSRSANTPDNPDTDGCKMMADCRDCLTKQLFLFPGFPQTGNDEADLLI